MVVKSIFPVFAPPYYFHHYRLEYNEAQLDISKHILIEVDCCRHVHAIMIISLGQKTIAGKLNPVKGPLMHL